MPASTSVWRPMGAVRSRTVPDVPDRVTGMPVWPYPDQVIELMGDLRLVLRADPLDDPVRRGARSDEGTVSELANAKCKSTPDRSRDPFLDAERPIQGGSALHAGAQPRDASIGGPRGVRL